MSTPLLFFLVAVTMVVVAVCAAVAYTDMVSAVLYGRVKWDKVGSGMVALGGVVLGAWGILRLIL